jgi:hypothetical protein
MENKIAAIKNQISDKENEEIKKCLIFLAKTKKSS